MVTLESGESVVRTGPVVWVGPPGPRPGTLSLTDRAIVFVGPIARPMPPGSRWQPGGGPPAVPGELRIALWRCRNASEVRGPRGPVLEVQLLARRVFFRTEDVPGWVQAINRARASAPPHPPGALGGGAGRAAGRQAPMPRCDYCGHLSAAGSTKCESCGAPF